MSGKEHNDDPTQQNESGLAVDNQEKQQDSSASEELTSPQNTSSSASASALANTPGDIDQLPMEHVQDPDPNVKAEIFFGEDSKLQSSDEDKVANTPGDIDQLPMEHVQDPDPTIRNVKAEIFFGETLQVNTPGDIDQLPMEHVQDPDPNVKAEIFFGEDSKLQSSDEDKVDDSLSGSTTNLVPPPVGDSRPPDSPAIKPSNLNLPVISVSNEDSVVADPPIDENPTGTKPKGTFLGRLVGHLSPSARKKSLTPSDSSTTPDSSTATQISSSDKNDESKTNVEDVQPSCSSGKPKIKKTKMGKNFFSKNKSPQDKKKSQFKLKSIVNVFSPKKTSGNEPLCNVDDPPKKKSEKSKSSRFWGDPPVPKDYQKEESVNFSETTVDSNSTQYSLYSMTTDSGTSEHQVDCVPPEENQQNSPEEPVQESPKSEDEENESEQ